MATTVKPHIIIVPGACHVEHHWRLFTSAMEKAGYGVTFQPLLCNLEDGDPPPLDSMTKSVAAIRAAALKHIENGRDVVVIAHSAGGAATGGALSGLGKTRSKHGVVRVVYLAAFLLEPGVSFAEKVQGHEPPYMEIRNGVTYIPKAKEWFFNDLPDDLADDAVSHLVGSSREMAEGRLDSVCWFDIPSVFVICERDKALPPSIAEWVITSVKVSWEIVRLDASHGAFLSMPDRVAAVVRWAAGEKGVDLEAVKFDTKQINAEKAAQEAGWTEATMAEIDAM